MEQYPIHSTEAENLVLNGILGNEETYQQVKPYLDGNPFYDDINSRIYNAILELDRKGMEKDAVSVLQMFYGQADYETIQDRIVDDILQVYTRDYVYYAKVVKGYWMKRRIWETCKRLEARCCNAAEDVDDIISDGTSAFDSVMQSVPNESISSMEKVMADFSTAVNNNTNGITEHGYRVGFEILDKSGGLHPNDLDIIAAESSQGKTALAMTLALNAAERGTRVVVYSMEMTSLQLGARFVAMKTDIVNSSLLYKPQSPENLYKIDQAVGRLSGLPIYFDDRSTNNIDVILSSIRRMHARFGIQVAVVDYIQMLTINSGMKNRNEEQMLGEIARRLKNIAKELGICVIALSQLNRNVDNPVPSMGRLRASGQLGEAADVVLLLYRPEAVSNGKTNRYPAPYDHVSTAGTAMLQVAKGRNTGLASCICGFTAEATRFYELENVPTNNAQSDQAKDNDKPF